MASSGWAVARSRRQRGPGREGTARYLAAGWLKLTCGNDACVTPVSYTHLHCAAIISPYGLPDDYVYINNVHSTFLVLNEAGRSGARRAVALSSLSALCLLYTSRCV